jgi:hypothetical protein
MSRSKPRPTVLAYHRGLPADQWRTALAGNRSRRNARRDSNG